MHRAVTSQVHRFVAPSEPSAEEALERVLDGDERASAEELAARWMADAVEQQLGGLPARQVEAFRLVSEEGCSLDQVPAWLRCTALAARLCAYRARASIRRHLGEACGSPGECVFRRT